MEYLYIVGIVAYYLYKAYSSNKKKQQEKAETIPPAQQSPKQKKKKGFFDEILEEIEKQNEAPAPAPQTIPTSREKKIEPRREIKPKKVEKKTATVLAEKHAQPLNKHFEMPKNEMEEEIANTDIQALLDKTNKPKSTSGFAGMNMTPKEALKAQIILERKY